MSDEPWLTKEEIARKKRVSVRTVERLRLPCQRVGGQNRYRESEVEAELERRQLGRELPAGDNVIPFRPRQKEIA